MERRVRSPIQPGLQKSVAPPPPLTISPSVPPKSRKRRLAPSSEDICSFSKGWRSSTARATPDSAAHSVKPLSMCTERLQGRPFHVQAVGQAMWTQVQPAPLRPQAPPPTPPATPKVELEGLQGWEAHCLSCHLYIYPHSHPYLKIHKDGPSQKQHPLLVPLPATPKVERGSLNSDMDRRSTS